jgi:hypothetical protein
MIFSLSPLNIDEVFITLLEFVFSNMSQTEGIVAACADGIRNFKAIN